MVERAHTLLNILTHQCVESAMIQGVSYCFKGRADRTPQLMRPILVSSPYLQFGP